MLKKRAHGIFIQRFFSSPLFLICGLVLSCLFIFAFFRNYYQDYHIHKEIEALQGEVGALEKKKLESLEILDYVMSDTFVEETARKELQYKKPGEHVIVVNTPTIYEEVDAGEEHVQGGLSNPIKWWYYFIHKDLSS
ncbi:MAG: septum formation initiator family protein [Candidatus Magasanikbacteria bacterium]|uniref:Septum formation initiator n=1 Tax=Candidatus Magasanikbacteria bacterium CG10_big_fil_rev_8_21_14_0_10_38_6 TaxID=1974647 RepID=A0A2M6P0I9_9BACT|nr:septum formation initiator family protein [Candidatus Magasanikbacteria bacterium]PIR77243.1 MAG: hypothetical protein COU30_03525 [Candidatus Magasanikbacteria bacterium CG10_big_fil_rev_8_21_14_0_10_38_6]